MAVAVRFGEKAIEMKLLTIEQVEEALQAQEDARRRGLDRSLGACLHDKGILDLAQVESVMKALGYPAEKCRLIPDVQIRSLIGRGATGAVYRGHSTALGADVAVKVRAPRGTTDDPQGNRFRAEAKILQRLIHPNIVRLYDAGETRDFAYHILEYVDGAALDSLLKSQGRLPERQVADIGMQLASALDYAGGAGIIHRDVKPANILLASTGRTKLCDLGFAKDLNRKTLVTADGVLIGSPFYIAPEYAKEGKLDGRSDIYCLGVTLYHCATGAVPFPGKTAMEILEKVVNAAPADPRSIVPELSEGFAKVVLRMIAKDPAERHQTPGELCEVLRALRAGDPPPARRGFFHRFLSLFTSGKKNA